MIYYIILKIYYESIEQTEIFINLAKFLSIKEICNLSLLNKNIYRIIFQKANIVWKIKMIEMTSINIDLKQTLNENFEKMESWSEYLKNWIIIKNNLFIKK